MTEEQGLPEEDADDALADKVDAALDAVDEATGKLRAILAEEPVRDLVTQLQGLIDEAAAAIDAAVENVRATLGDADEGEVEEG